jgi:regulator of telomere elongation helicase 1
VRKKKKEEVHKVSVDLQKHENSRYEVKSVPNAFFPFEPYPEQISLISKVNDAIQKCENVLIESPTGTGKTLCMLVGSLSSVCSLS